MLTRSVSLTQFRTFGAPLGAISWARQAVLRPQIVPNMAFWPLKWSSGGPNLARFGPECQFGVFWTNSSQFGPPLTILAAERQNLGLIRASKWLVCPWNGPLVVLRGAPTVQNWVSDTDLVNIGQLDHYVVIGTKFGAVQDFQRGKKSSWGVQQNPLDPPRPPQTWPQPPNPPLNPLSDPS